MCEVNVYLIDESGEEKLIFKAVDKIEPYGSGLCLENIFYQRKYIMAKIKEMSLAERRIILESLAEPRGGV
ncbi:MAG: CooT family nickel-binding protein [Ruminiclostridium sp.]